MIVTGASDGSRDIRPYKPTKISDFTSCSLDNEKEKISHYRTFITFISIAKILLDQN